MTTNKQNSGNDYVLLGVAVVMLPFYVAKYVYNEVRKKITDMPV